MSIVMDDATFARELAAVRRETRRLEDASRRIEEIVFSPPDRSTTAIILQFYPNPKR